MLSRHPQKDELYEFGLFFTQSLIRSRKYGGVEELRAFTQIGALDEAAVAAVTGLSGVPIVIVLSSIS
jgi:hypothetical protein